ncbi:MAG: family 10 glycosylhydrolase [Ruminococcus sp.]|nr:family 10 glycosylhydrolase [Ruminococcus sp.]
MKIKNKIPLFLSITALISVIAFSSSNNITPSETVKKENKAVKTSNTEIESEMRGVWVTYMDLDMQETDLSYKSFKKKFKEIADKSKKDKFNTLIVQVRPFSDALYDSSYYPYSHIISGTQGKNPGYDPLKYMCAYSHKIGLKIHAWINPYRVRSSRELRLSENNPYKNNKQLGVKVGDGIYYNPALSGVRKLIENGIREIVNNYDVDGIQFDDYFYPTSKESFDKKQYKKYCDNVGLENAMSLEEWRIANVNILIAECYTIVHNNQKNIVFGISPQGNIENDYEMYADVKSWCEKSGYIDYICPQLYYSLDNPALTFERALKNWTSLNYNDNVTLYIGIAGYKTGTDLDGGTWSYSDKILQEEVKLIRKRNIKGFMFYSFANLESKKAAKEVSNLVEILD